MAKASDKISLSIAGTGNVAWHLTNAFHKAGVPVRYVISRNKKRAAKLAEKVGATPALYSDIDFEPTEVTLLCVSDDAIEEVASKLTNSQTIIVHTSGSMGIEVFKPSFVEFGVLYPLQTFTSGTDMNYADIPFFIEASDDNVRFKLFNLANTISPKVFELNSEKRSALHISAVYACNFVNHMVTVGASIIEDAGLDFELLRPLIQETFNKLNYLSPLDAQTGPAMRGDSSIIASHLKSLENKPGEKELYRLISESIERYNKKL